VAVRGFQVFLFKTHLDIDQDHSEYKRHESDSVGNYKQESQQRGHHAEKDRISRAAEHAGPDELRSMFTVDADSPRCSHLRLRCDGPTQGGDQ